MVRERRLHRPGAAADLRALADRDVNFAPVPEPVPSWNHRWCLDELRCTLGREEPGGTVAGGAFEIACHLVRDYQFADPRIVRALYRRDAPLLGRDMLLEGRFCGLRFDMGVRVTSVVDELRPAGAAVRRAWGWGYQTLHGHLEEGGATYLVVKHLRTGVVEFRVSAYSRRAPIADPLVTLGFHTFGRATQHRFYRTSALRLYRLVRAQLHGAPVPARQTVPGADGLIVAPSLLPEPSLLPDGPYPPVSSR